MQFASMALAVSVACCALAAPAGAAPLPHSSPLYNAAGSPIVNGQEQAGIAKAFSGAGKPRLSRGAFERLSGAKVVAVAGEPLAQLAA
jgi:hypothetical protein